MCRDQVFKNALLCVPQWNRIAAQETQDWDEVFTGYQATVDWPACNYYRELMARYPQAKVILSVRPADKWFASTQATIFRDVDPALRPPFISKIVGDIVGPDWHDEAALITGYEKHNAAVRAYVPKARLLEFEPSQGWAPLCAFLDVPVPDQPYPTLNTTEQFLASGQTSAVRMKSK